MNYWYRKNAIILWAIVCQLTELFASKNFSALSHDTLQGDYGIIEYAGLVFRHGDRTPESLYPTDPYQNYAWPVDLGQLTNDGKRREYTLGKYFEPRYNCITGSPYLPSRVVMDSSSYDRCLMSGELFYAGYYPPVGSEIWNENISWQPIPVHSAPAAIDNVILQSKPCPLLTQIRNNFYATSAVIRNVCAVYRNLYVYIEKYSGLNMTPCESYQSSLNLISLQDALLIETQLNLTLPEWTNAVFPEPLTTLRAQLVLAEMQNPIARKLIAGPLLNVLASDMLNIAHLNNTLPQTLYTSSASQTRPLHLFSGHDLTIVSLMRALNVYQNVSPPYGAAMGLELRSRDNTYYVTVIYEYSLSKPPQTINIPGCQTGCTLAHFLSLILPLIPQNWEAECNVVTSTSPADTSFPTTSPSTSISSTSIAWNSTAAGTSPLNTLTTWTPPIKPPFHAGHPGADNRPPFWLAHGNRHQNRFPSNQIPRNSNSSIDS